MKKITKENLGEFLSYYHNLHDCFITNVNYNILDSRIELVLNNVECDDGKNQVRMVFNDVQQCDVKEMYSWDLIMDCYLNYIIFEEDEYICFANDEKDPMIYIICEDIEYEEVK